MAEHEKKPELVEVVFETTPQFDLETPEHVDALVEDIKQAILTDFRETFLSSGTLRIRGSKNHC